MAQVSPNGSIELCGVRVHRLSMQQVLARAENAIRHRRPLAISVVNVAKLVNMRSDAILRESVESGDLILADGMPLVWLSRLKRRPLPERVAGIDLMFELLRLADRQRLRVYFLGAERDTLRRVVDVARHDYPNLVVAGFRDGYFREDQEEEVARAIGVSAADILFVAISSPKKELFICRWGSVLRVPVCHGVGGSFDVMAGKTRRAPRWMQGLGLEWFYRLMQEPRRLWKRYLVTNVEFATLACLDLLCSLRKRPSIVASQQPSHVTFAASASAMPTRQAARD